jgi:hypothetical protein
LTSHFQNVIEGWQKDSTIGPIYLQNQLPVHRDQPYYQCQLPAGSLLVHSNLVFETARLKFQTWIYNLRTVYLDTSIYLGDDDVTPTKIYISDIDVPSTIRQLTYMPNILSAKVFLIGSYLLILTGLTNDPMMELSLICTPFHCITNI